MLHHVAQDPDVSVLLTGLSGDSGELWLACRFIWHSLKLKYTGKERNAVF